MGACVHSCVHGRPPDRPLLPRHDGHAIYIPHQTILCENVAVVYKRNRVPPALSGEDPVLDCGRRRGWSSGRNRPQGEESVRERGVVKWFNPAKGYGFIQRSSGEDVFVHYSAIQMDGYRTLDQGIEVEYDLKEGPKGLQAENVSHAGA